MSLSKLEAPKDWELISTTAVTGTPASISLTGFGNYKDLLVLASNIATTDSTQILARPNNSSTNAHYFNSLTTGSANSTFMNAAATGNNKSVSLEILNINTTQPKQVSAMLSNAGGQKTFFYDGSKVTSLTLLPNSGTFNNAGNIYLFGRN